MDTDLKYIAHLRMLKKIIGQPTQLTSFSTCDNANYVAKDMIRIGRRHKQIVEKRSIERGNLSISQSLYNIH